MSVMALEVRECGVYGIRQLAGELPANMSELSDDEQYKAIEDAKQKIDDCALAAPVKQFMFAYPVADAVHVHQYETPIVTLHDLILAAVERLHSMSVAYAGQRTFGIHKFEDFYIEGIAVFDDGSAIIHCGS